jgi:predicted RNA-binding protein YlxR (DUF448 family)
MAVAVSVRNTSVTEQFKTSRSRLASGRSLYVARERSQLATASRKELEELELITAVAVSVKNHTVPEQFLTLLILL